MKKRIISCLAATLTVACYSFMGSPEAKADQLWRRKVCNTDRNSHGFLFRYCDGYSLAIGRSGDAIMYQPGASDRYGYWIGSGEKVVVYFADGVMALPISDVLGF